MTIKIGMESKNNFDSIIILSAYRKYNDVDIYFPEYDWTYFNAHFGMFKNRTVKCPYEPRIFNVGYIGEGIYKSKINKEHVRSYTTWYKMLQRCYDDMHRYKFTSYSDCYVCDEWLNYQKFAEWYENNYYEISSGEQMHIDKDILYKGNVIYSPETCIFVPKTINNLILKREINRGDLPIGVWYDESRNNYKACCCDGHGKIKTIGRYKTVEEAFTSYKDYKEQVIKSIADIYKNEIPLELYNALYDYTVDIYD